MESLFGGSIPNFGQNNDDEEETPTDEVKTKRSEIKQQLLNGQLEDEKVRLKVEQDPAAMGMLGYEPKPTNARHDEPINA